MEAHLQRSLATAEQVMQQQLATQNLHMQLNQQHQQLMQAQAAAAFPFIQQQQPQQQMVLSLGHPGGTTTRGGGQGQNGATGPQLILQPNHPNQLVVNGQTIQLHPIPQLAHQTTTTNATTRTRPVPSSLYPTFPPSSLSSLPTPSHILPAAPASSTSALRERPPQCNTCGRTPANTKPGMTQEEKEATITNSKAILARCSGCRAVYYCSRTCQRTDWIRHKFLCKHVRTMDQQQLLFLKISSTIPGNIHRPILELDKQSSPTNDKAKESTSSAFPTVHPTASSSAADPSSTIQSPSRSRLKRSRDSSAVAMIAATAIAAAVSQLEANEYDRDHHAPPLTLAMTHTSSGSRNNSSGGVPSSSVSALTSASRLSPTDSEDDDDSSSEGSSPASDSEEHEPEPEVGVTNDPGNSSESDDDILHSSSDGRPCGPCNSQRENNSSTAGQMNKKRRKLNTGKSVCCCGGSEKVKDEAASSSENNKKTETPSNPDDPTASLTLQPSISNTEKSPPCTKDALAIQPVVLVPGTYSIKSRECKDIYSTYGHHPRYGQTCLLFFQSRLSNGQIFQRNREVFFYSSNQSSTQQQQTGQHSLGGLNGNICEWIQEFEGTTPLSFTLGIGEVMECWEECIKTMFKGESCTIITRDETRQVFLYELQLVDFW